MADLYSDVPELAAQEQAILRRKKIAEAMLARGQQPLETSQMAGGQVIPVSWTQGLAQLANAYLGVKKSQEADKEYGSLADKRRQMVVDAMTGINQTAQGSAGVEGIKAQPARTIQAPMPMQEGQVAPNYNTQPETVPAVAGRAAVPAVAGDKRAAVLQAMMSNLPEIQRYGATMQANEVLDQNQKFKSEESQATRAATAEQRQLDREAKMESLKEQIRSREMMGQQSNDLKAAMANLAAESRMDVARLVASNKSESQSAPIAVMDENGNPVFVDRRDAIGKTPYVQGQKSKVLKEKDDKNKRLLDMTLDAEIDNIDKLIGSDTIDPKTKKPKYTKHKGLDASIGSIDARFPTVLQDTADAEALQESLRSKASISSLQTIRGTSGAIGSLTEKEWPRLEAMKATLQSTQGTPQFTSALKDYRNELRNIKRMGAESLQDDSSGGTPPSESGKKPTVSNW